MNVVERRENNSGNHTKYLWFGLLLIDGVIIGFSKPGLDLDLKGFRYKYPGKKFG